MGGEGAGGVQGVAGTSPASKSATRKSKEACNMLSIGPKHTSSSSLEPGSLCWKEKCTECRYRVKRMERLTGIIRQP